MSRSRVIGTVAATLAVAGGLAVSAAATAPSGSKPMKHRVPHKVTKVTKAKKTKAPSADSGHPVSHQASGDAATYWTPERMRNAKPAPMGEPGEAPSANPQTAQGRSAAGSPPGP
jgi:hypothetical protein